MVAVVLSALDSFNPCAFLVLLFSLILLVNALSRGRTLLVGGTLAIVCLFVFTLSRRKPSWRQGGILKLVSGSS